MSFLLLSLAFNAIVAVGVASGASFALRYYRGRFEAQEKRALGTISITVVFLILCLLDIQHFIPGKNGEIASSVLVVCVIVAGIVRVIQQLKQRV